MQTIAQKNQTNLWLSLMGALHLSCNSYIPGSGADLPPVQVKMMIPENADVNLSS